MRSGKIIFEKIGKYFEATRCYENCKKINKNYKGVSGNILHMKMFSAEWKDIKSLSQEVENEIRLGYKTASPFSLIFAESSKTIQKALTH